MRERQILVPIDNSPLSTQTIQGLTALKDEFVVPLTLLHVLDFSLLSYRGFGTKGFREIEAEARTVAQNFLEQRQAELSAVGFKVETLLKEGHVRETICELADSGAYDLLVIGKPVDSDMRNLLFGQVANYLIHHVSCPVLLV